MQKVLLVGTSLFACVLLAWAGGDPWKDKPYQQWDQKDVNRILNDSPWAKVVRVDAPWRGEAPNTEGKETGSNSNSPKPSMRGAGGGGYGAGAGGGGDEEEGESNQGSAVAQAPFMVRWNSSRTIREAILRDSLLKGRIQQADIEKAMALPMEEYMVLVAGPDMTPLEKADENSLKGQAFLSTKKAKQRILPDKVQVLRSDDGKNITAVVFLFPKKAANGEVDVVPDEKGIDFVLTVGKLRLKAGFDPPKMADQQGRDL